MPRYIDTDEKAGKPVVTEVTVEYLQRKPDGSGWKVLSSITVDPRREKK